jgi:hypothetical protein
MVYCLRSTVGSGWVRELFDGRPIITADPAEAMQLVGEDDARRVCRMLNQTSVVQLRFVRLEGHRAPIRHGEP